MISSSEKKVQQKQWKKWNLEINSTSVKHITLVGNSAAAFTSEPTSEKDEMPPLCKASFFIQHFELSKGYGIIDLACLIIVQ